MRTWEGKRTIEIIFCVVALLFLVTIPAAWAAGPKDVFVEGELLLQFKAGLSEERAEAVIKAHGAFVGEEIVQLRTKRILVPAQAVENVKAALSRNPNVNFVENNYLAGSSFIPNDLKYSSQWHLPVISAPECWDLTTGSSEVVIAVIDSGVDPTHPDLATKLLPGWNFLNANSDTHDVLGHGTAVAGTAAALTNNTTGVAGMAWANHIMPLVVLDSSDYASYSNIASAIVYAADHGARVINISIGGSSSSSTLQNAVSYAWNKGVVIFASAMNNANSTPYYPAACTNVIAVSATTSSDTLASFSSYGSWVDLSAPGASIYTTNNGGGYGAWNGTSFSSPMTAGLAALVLSVNPSLTNAQVEALLKQGSDDLGTPGFDPYFGYGRIDAYKTVVAAQNFTPQPDLTSPFVSVVSPAPGSAVSGLTSVNVSAGDDVGVSKVELFVDGILYAMDTTGPYSFSWDTTGIANGTHELIAYAYDAAGNIGESDPVSVTVGNSFDTTKPVVAITSPANNSVVSNKVTITVSASDNVKVSKIELYIDGSLKSTATSVASLQYQWNTKAVKVGAHTISAKGYDSAGNVGLSSITVYKQ
ncbi:MAG: S8 family serine peptidase [Nitrospirales bacterium]|nr:S8 family serine peptidase [Nitrospirales bacterium]